MAKVLIIEDTENNRVLLTRRLKPKGYEVVLAEDAERGLDIVVAERPDLILMDVGLPGMDGWEATRKLKSNPETRSIPVIALTAHAMQGDRDRALEAGCDDYETKPIDFNRLFEKIERLTCLSRRQHVGEEGTKPGGRADTPLGTLPSESPAP